MKPKASSVPSAQKIERVETKPFSSWDEDTIKYGLIHLIDKINEIIDRLNADQPEASQGGEDGNTPYTCKCIKDCLVLGDKVVCHCKHGKTVHPIPCKHCQPSSPQDTKCDYCEVPLVGKACRNPNCYHFEPLESGQAGETMEQRFDSEFKYLGYDFESDQEIHLVDDQTGYDKTYKEAVKDFIKLELARQLSEIRTGLDRLIHEKGAKKLGEHLEMAYGKRECVACGTNPERQRRMILDYLDQQEK